MLAKAPPATVVHLKDVAKKASARETVLSGKV
jgi:hypothetical protein